MICRKRSKKHLRMESSVSGAPFPHPALGSRGKPTLALDSGLRGAIQLSEHSCLDSVDIAHGSLDPAMAAHSFKLQPRPGGHWGREYS
jgi:hypothetical protein